MLHTLDCPHCRQAINVEESITRQIEQQVLHRIQHQQADQVATVQRQAAELQRREAELQQAIATQQSQVSELVQIQSTTLRQQLSKQLREEQSGQLAALHEELAEKSAKVQELSKREGDLLRQQRALEEQRASIDGLVEKRVRAERNQIEMLALQKARDEGQFSLDQQQGLINSLRDQLAAMKRKIEQGSQQTQGEIMEVALEQLLADTFPFDTIQEVVKGQNGADIIQDVRNEFGRPCGRMIYESKRTKQFSVAWIDKLKADQQAHKGDIAVLVTEAMPKDLPHFGLYNGVYVCSFGEAKAVASLLREGVIRVGEAQVAGENKGVRCSLFTIT
jgi:hypothetical protein